MNWSGPFQHPQKFKMAKEFGTFVQIPFKSDLTQPGCMQRNLKRNRVGSETKINIKTELFLFLLFSRHDEQTSTN